VFFFCEYEGLDEGDRPESEKRREISISTAGRGPFAFECLNDNDQRLRHIEKVFPQLLSLLSDVFSWQKWVFFNATRGVIFVRTE
jgi:hypothetical protein